MTPRQFGLMVERYRERVKREDRRAGEMIAMFYNANRDTDKDPNGIEWQDLFPEWKEYREQTEEELAEAMRAWGKLGEGLST